MAKAARTLVKVSTLMVVGGALALGALSSNCGGGGERTGSGGSGGGTGGGSGGSGGGTGGATTLSCANALAPQAGGLLTDFSDYNMGSGKWGPVGSLRGSRFSYAAPAMDGGLASTASWAIDTTAADADLHFTATVEPSAYAGVGLSFDACATLAGYSGLRFAISGSLGGCALELQIQTFSQKPTNENPAGGCDRSLMDCYAFPRKLMVAMPTSTDMTITVPFAELEGWTAANAAEVVGIQWQVTVPAVEDGGVQTACSVDLRIDDVAFVP
jgi:hypothetical protein